MATKKENDIILKEIYPKVSSKLKTNLNKYKQCIGRFIERRSKDLYDIAPFERIYFREEDIEDFFKSIGIEEKEITNLLSKTYYYDIPNFNPRAAKDEFTITMMCVIRYFFKSKMKKELELSMMYLSFSGKFYPSIHSGCFPVVSPGEHRYVMEYVVNNRLSNKYDIKREGNLFNGIKSVANTWLNTYNDKLDTFEDDDVVYMIQQLRDRIKSSIQNVAKEYYKVYNDKDAYMTYDRDANGEDAYRVADNDSLKIERIVENTMTNLNSNSIDYRVCKMASDSNVKTDEIKSIIETILNDDKNLIEVKELIRLIVSIYFLESKNKDVRDVEFISKSITPKPNSKNPNVLREKEIIETWLNESSPAYRKRKSRAATKSSYYKSILTYFVILIHNSNR